MRCRKLWRGHARTRFAQERGAVAVMVAILSTVLFGFAAFAIDLGNSWQTRRHLITASDAGALAAAKDLATGVTTDCQPPASDYANRNFSASYDTCNWTGNTNAGKVTVKTTK